LATRTARQTSATQTARQTLATQTARQTLATNGIAEGPSLLFQLASGLGATGTPGPVSTGPVGPERLDNGLRQHALRQHALPQDGLRRRGSGAERARETEHVSVPGCSEPRQADLFLFAEAS
jgi:hypothetical protein